MSINFITTHQLSEAPCKMFQGIRLILNGLMSQNKLIASFLSNNLQIPLLRWYGTTRDINVYKSTL